MIAPREALTALENDLEPGERVLYTTRPDIGTTIRNKAFLWWIGVPLCIAIGGLFLAGVSWAVLIPFGLVGLVMLATPIVLAFETRSTLYAITDRRALILRTGFRPSKTSCPCDRMDATPEVMTANGKSGHLTFASDMSTKMRDVDYTGKLAFRDLADVHAAAIQLKAARNRNIES